MNKIIHFKQDNYSELSPKFVFKLWKFQEINFYSLEKSSENVW